MLMFSIAQSNTATASLATLIHTQQGAELQVWGARAGEIFFQQQKLSLV